MLDIEKTCRNCRYYLDEGIGIFDKNKNSNLQTANNNVANSKDSRLQEFVNSRSMRIPELRDNLLL